MFGSVITGTICACVVFLRRRDSRNNSEGQNETVRGGSCDGQPFKKKLNFFTLPSNWKLIF